MIIAGSLKADNNGAYQITQTYCQQGLVSLQFPLALIYVPIHPN